MGAVVKNPITQLTQGSAQVPTSDFFLDESLARIPTITSKEICSLSRFLPVIVLINKSAIKRLAVREITESNSLTETSESTKLLGLFGQAVDLLKIADTNSVVAFGDVIVNFSALEVHRHGQPVVLTALEFKTLKYFVQNARRVISRDELLNEVGIRELSLHPHRGQPYLEVASKTGARPIAARSFPNGAWGRLQILTVASRQEGKGHLAIMKCDRRF